MNIKVSNICKAFENNCVGTKVTHEAEFRHELMHALGRVRHAGRRAGVRPVARRGVLRDQRRLCARVRNLAGGNASFAADKKTVEDLITEAKAIASYEMEWVVVADPVA